MVVVWDGAMVVVRFAGERWWDRQIRTRRRRGRRRRRPRMARRGEEEQLALLQLPLPLLPLLLQRNFLHPPELPLPNPPLLPLLHLHSPLQTLPKAQHLPLPHPELPIQHRQKLALDAPHIALAKHARAQRPVHVLQRRVVEVLARGDEGAEEYALESPFFEGDVQVGPGAGDVEERGEEGGRGDLGAGEDGADEGRELELRGRARCGWAAARARGRCRCGGGGGGLAHGVVDGLDYLVNDVVDELLCDLDVH